MGRLAPVDAALRCPSCRTAWPNTPEFLRCPDCQVTTSRQDAKPVANTFAFERYARRWDLEQAALKTAAEKARAAQFDAVAKGAETQEIAELDARLAQTPYIPDPDEGDQA